MSHRGLLNSLQFSECQSPLNCHALHHSTASDYPVCATAWANISLGCKKMHKERNMSLGFWSWQNSGRPNGMLIWDKDKRGNLTFFLSHGGWSKWLPLQVEKLSSLTQRSIWVKLYAFNPAPSTEKDFFPPFFKKWNSSIFRWPLNQDSSKYIILENLEKHKTTLPNPYLHWKTIRIFAIINVLILAKVTVLSNSGLNFLPRTTPPPTPLLLWSLK